ncbi:hypothetical protein BVAVS116_H0128 (plasmid) [Borreliella valaisiana VS116]|uniref:Uncharacterized protein n=1 Tax=Borreliella valaisiana VS116 TaxID=445987 RepID=C0R943_BORVA|nr:hypothetical protein BVAVS116_H0128 [Borreliella valaisiana VS116]
MVFPILKLILYLLKLYLLAFSSKTYIREFFNFRIFIIQTLCTIIIPFSS